MSILFTCVGNSDPIRGFYSGPILCICEEYLDIDEIYAVYSTKMVECDTNKMEITIDYFNKKNNRNIIFHKIKTNIDNPQDYDAVYEPILDYVSELFINHPNEKIYFNLSSGTPQMTEVLSLIATSTSYSGIVTIQSLDPKGKIGNKRNTKQTDDKEYIFEEELEAFLDFDQEYRDLYGKRCIEPKMHGILKINFKNKLRSLLEVYNYRTILDIFKNELVNYPVSSSLIRHMNYRISCDFDLASDQIKYLNKNINDYLPYSNNYKQNQLLEYYLILSSIKKANSINDFVIKSIVFIYELIKELIKKQYNLDIEKLFYKTSKGIIDYDKLYQYDINLYNYVVDNQYPNNNDYWNLYRITRVLEYYYDNNKNNLFDFNLLKFLDKMNELNKLARNPAAHNLAAIKEKELNQIISIDNILLSSKKILDYLYPKIKQDYYNIYDNINKEIIDNL